MGLSNKGWTLILIATALLALISPVNAPEGKFSAYGFGAVVGRFLVIILFPCIIPWIVMGIGAIINKKPSDKIKSTLFIVMWVFFGVFGTLGSIMKNRPDRMDRQTFIDECLKTIENHQNYDLIDEAMDIDAYCNCGFDNLLKSKIDDSDLLELSDPNSKLFNDLLVPCLNSAVYDTEEEVESEIVGWKLSDTIPVENLLNVLRVKVIIGGEAYYFMLDSGASDITIGTKLEARLNELGLIEEYQEDQQYQLADGSIIDCKTAIVNDIQIGEYIVRQSLVAIVPDQPDAEIEQFYLLGNSFLEHFTSWTYQSETNQLILVK